MRTWRKIYASMLESSQVASLSDRGIVLLTMLIIAQDDTGFYPWERTKVNRLTLIRPKWNAKTVQLTLKELCSAKLVEFVDDGVVLLKGSQLNGNPRKDIDDLIYERQRRVDVTLTEDQRDVDNTLLQSRLDLSRLDKSREDAKVDFSGLEDVFEIIHSIDEPDAKKEKAFVKWASKHESDLILEEAHSLYQKWDEAKKKYGYKTFRGGLQGWVRREEEKRRKEVSRNGGSETRSSWDTASQEERIRILEEEQEHYDQPVDHT